MAGPLDLLIPPRLLLRALDDLHAIAVAAHEGTERLEALDLRAAQIERQFDLALETAEQLNAIGVEALGLLRDFEGRAAAMLELGAEMQALGQRIGDQGEVLDERAGEVIEATHKLIEALPTLEQAVSLVSPLEGTVERLGRMVDRLPGGRAGAVRHRHERSEPDESPR